MTSGRTYWYAEDASYLKRALVIELGEEFGPAVPGVLQSLKGDAKHQNDGGRVLTGFVTVSRDAFVGDAGLVRRIVERAAEIGLLDDLEIQADGRRFSCRLSGWQADQEKVRAAQRQAAKRARDESEQDVTDRDNTADSHGASQKVTHTGQNRTENNSLVAASDDDGPRSLLVQRVWAAYNDTRLAVFGARHGAKLTTARKQLISRRLKEWPVDDLADAVRGWRHVPHNRGDNERGQPFCDLELVLRDAAHIERFRDAERGVAATANGSSVDEGLAAFARLYGNDEDAA